MPSLRQTQRPSTRLSLEQRLELRWATYREMKKLKDELDRIDKDLLPDLPDPDDVDDDEVTVESDSCKSRIVASSNSRIDRGTLIELGVSPRIVKKATKSTPYRYVRQDPIKDKDVERDDRAERGFRRGRR